MTFLILFVTRKTSTFFYNISVVLMCFCYFSQFHEDTWDLINLLWSSWWFDFTLLLFFSGHIQCFCKTTILLQQKQFLFLCWWLSHSNFSLSELPVSLFLSFNRFYLHFSVWLWMQTCKKKTASQQVLNKTCFVKAAFSSFLHDRVYVLALGSAVCLVD